MKLILCPICQDVVKCGRRRKRKCACGASWGKYTDEIFAEIGGKAIPICLHNMELCDAIEARPDKGRGPHFTAWIPPRVCQTIKTIK